MIANEELIEDIVKATEQNHICDFGWTQKQLDLY